MWPHHTAISCEAGTSLQLAETLRSSLPSRRCFRGNNLQSCVASVGRRDSPPIRRSPFTLQQHSMITIGLYVQNYGIPFGVQPVANTDLPSAVQSIPILSSSLSSTSRLLLSFSVTKVILCSDPK